jgi:hypothetical protein
LRSCSSRWIIPRKLDKETEMPVAQPLDPTPAPKWLDTWWPWLNGAIALVIISYGPMLYQLWSTSIATRKDRAVNIQTGSNKQSCHHEVNPPILLIRVLQVEGENP